jgi:hypothetical protein
MTAKRAKHVVRCLRRCKKFTGALLDALDRRQSHFVSTGGPAFHEFIALRRTVERWSQQINMGMSGLRVRAELNPACSALIREMNDPERSPIPKVLTSGVEVAAALGITLPSKYKTPKPSKHAQGSTASQEQRDAISAVTTSCPNHIRTMKAVSDAAADNGNRSAATTELAKQCSKAVSDADEAGRELAKKLDDIAGASGQNPAARRAARAPVSQRRHAFAHKVTAAPARPRRLTPQQAAEQRWDAMGTIERSHWISREVFIRAQLREAGNARAAVR